MGERLANIARRNARINIPKRPMKYTAVVQRIREISVEAETLERATRLLQRRLDKDEKILSIQTSLL